MRASGPWLLLTARARRQGARWLPSLIGIALAVAFVGAVASESVIISDQQARSVLSSVSPLERTVRLVWQGPLAPGVERQARRLLGNLGLRPLTEVTLLSPVRLGGVIVRPAAIAPLRRWLSRWAEGVGWCRSADCPMLLVGGGRMPSRLGTAAGLDIRVLGRATLRSNVPLGYVPEAQAQSRVLVSGDPQGLDRLSGLSGVYRTHSWLAPLAMTPLHSWNLTALEHRLAQAQAALTASSSQFSVNAPFEGLALASGQARDASTRLRLAGGGAAAALVLFLVIVTASLRREQLAELGRLRRAGARLGHAAVFVAGEAAWLVALGILAGFAGSVLAGVVLAHLAGEPTGPILVHGVLSPGAGLVLAGIWLATVAAGVVALLPAWTRLTDALAIAAVALLAGGLYEARSASGASAFLLVPLSCLAAGVLLLRGMTWVLRGGERLARAAPLSVRLAAVGLARTPGLPALAIMFLAVSVALGGFGLAYRATLERGAADQAADRVPLDALIAPGSSFTTPVQLAPLERWRALSGGAVFPVRRTQASFASGIGYRTVTALGVSPGALRSIRGWRTSDGSAPLARLAERLTPRGPVREPGPRLPRGTEVLSMAARSPQLALSVTAYLRRDDGEIRQLALGTAGPGRRVLTARVPRGRWELEALELDEPTGLLTTDTHQNGESATPATQQAASLSLGPMLVTGAAGHVLLRVSLGGWRDVGAASAATGSSQLRAARITFRTSGAPGIIRPAQPFDSRPLPVLADPATAAAAGPGQLLGLTVDEQPLTARVVGVLRRFPTIDPGASGFIVANQAVLASALDGALPGQGRPDELWITSRHTTWRRMLQSSSLAQLAALFRADVQTRLERRPLQRGLNGTLLGAAAIGGGLALAGLVLVLLGPFRDRQMERELEEQGAGPRELRADLVWRAGLAGALGVLPGLAIALILAVVAAPSLGGAALGTAPWPPLVTVIPWPALGAVGIGTVIAVPLVAWTASRSLFTDSRLMRAAQDDQPPGHSATRVKELAR